MFKLLLSPGRYSAWDQFLGFSGYFGSLTDVNGYSGFLADVCGYLILVKFSGIIRLVESGGFLRYGVDISGNFRLMDLSGFFKFQFRVKVISYKTFLFAIKGGK